VKEKNEEYECQHEGNQVQLGATFSTTNPMRAIISEMVPEPQETIIETHARSINTGNI
jgi:hypothetical protein